MKLKPGVAQCAAVTGGVEREADGRWCARRRGRILPVAECSRGSERGGALSAEGYSTVTVKVVPGVSASCSLALS